MVEEAREVVAREEGEDGMGEGGEKKDSIV
jgi:hypothetical protein